MRPGVLAEPRPQERVQRHTMEHIVDFVCCSPMVQILDAPVPQMVEQLPDVLWFFDLRSFLFSSKLSKCPRFFLRTSLFARFCVTRSWQNSWWKCRRSYLIPLYSGIWSKTSTFQFPVVEGELPVFKVFFPDRVQQRRVLQRNALLSGLWSRSSISPSVEASKIFAQDRVHPLLRTFQLVLMMLWMRLVRGFSHFSPN